MKNYIFIALICSIFLYSNSLFAQPAANLLLPQVDKRVELVCIAAKLADIKGFNDQANPTYSNKIDKHFSPFKNHPFIKYLKELKPKLDESYWVFPAVAAHLNQKLEPLMDFNDTSNADDWESRELFNAKFVTLLQQFYKDSKAAKFFNSQENYYKSVNQEYEKQGVKLNKKWLEDFFGLKTTEDYFPIVALGMRQGAYMRVNFANNYRHTFTIYEMTAFDDRGIPTTFKNPYIPRMMLHEYIHAFTNQLVDKNKSVLQNSAETILKNPKVFNIVKDTFYGNWQYLLYESLVRACSIKYLAINKDITQDIEKEIVAQEKAGFLWMRGLLKELDNYEANKTKYKNFAEYMPQLILFFEKTAKELKD
ncbi:MAG: DUF4932 domain-containing protein [Pyrinomonadaceae bacterium]|nr:DUF4932 domain-containing protein [Pyrinomonadaceae bacterium]